MSYTEQENVYDITLRLREIDALKDIALMEGNQEGYSKLEKEEVELLSQLGDN